MSEELLELEQLHVGSFAGGIGRGPCIQLSLIRGAAELGYVQLDREDVAELVCALREWFDG